MFKQLSAILLSCFLFLSGCATAKKSILLGSTIGIGIGAGIGSTQENQNGTMVGAVIGGLLGGLIGYSGYDQKQKKEQAARDNAGQARFDMFSAADPNANRPKLKPAEVRVRYIEDQVKDGTFIPAHLEYEISEPARWDGAK
jgi:hypothetical protein